MTITYSYLRVSTDEQDVSNQRHGVLEYANAQGLSLVFVEDQVSGAKQWRDRKLGTLILETASAGDVVIFAEITRIARSTLQVLEVLQVARERELTIHIAKQRMTLDDSIQATIMSTVLALVGEIDRAFIQMRTREALHKRRAEGMTLGRPKGAKSSQLLLDPHSREIQNLLDKGVSKCAIARLYNCSPGTVSYWVKERKELLKSA
jgi:DNA invertase Pin-like site-specific DNA recombinase